MHPSKITLSILTLLLVTGFLLHNSEQSVYEDKYSSQETEESATETTADIATSTQTQEEPQKQEVKPENLQALIQEQVDSLREVPVSSSPTPKHTDNDPEPPKEPEKETIPFSEINTNTRLSLINILCTTKTGGVLSPISGSGVIIDPKGIVLTNAHVAQYFLLKDYTSEDYITCVGRTGSPARHTYTLEPLYISSSWIQANAEQITASNALGTGEYDYALLAITGKIDGGDIDTTLPFVSLSKNPNIKTGASVYIGGYPAGFIGGITVQKDLNITSTIGSIENIYTFADGTADLITVKGSILSQSGASGGAVMDDQGELSGVIVTSTSADSTSERTLGAITTPYIDKDFKRQVGVSLETFMKYSMAGTIESFWETVAPSLTELLVNELEK